jgi:hypothetical protein
VAFIAFIGSFGAIADGFSEGFTPLPSSTRVLLEKYCPLLFPAVGLSAVYVAFNLNIEAIIDLSNVIRRVSVAIMICPILWFGFWLGDSVAAWCQSLGDGDSLSFPYWSASGFIVSVGLCARIVVFDRCISLLAKATKTESNMRRGPL